MSQGWNVNPTTDQITFLEAPANTAAIVVKEYATVDLNVTDVWALGAWSAAYGYPGEVEFFADRLTFAATAAQPQTMWLSRSGDYTFFGKSTPIVDDDSINATLNARGLNRINDLIPLQNLAVLTSGSEWRSSVGAGDAVTPSTLGFRPQTHIGAASLPALVVGSTAIFAQTKGYTVYEMAYDLASYGYTGGDLTVFSAHLLEHHTIRDWCWQQVPYSIVWSVRNDGMLLSLTYKREQQVVGWMRQVTGAPRAIVRGNCGNDLAPYDEFEQTCSVPEANINAVYVAVKRRLGNGSFVRYIERMAEPKKDLVDYIGLDSTLSTDGRVCASSTTGGITLYNRNPVPLYVTMTNHGYALLSDDLTLFSAVYTGINVHYVAIAANLSGRIVAISLGVDVSYSDDRGQTWTQTTTGISGFSGRDMCWSPTLGLFIAIGVPSGWIGNPVPGLIAVSPTGVVWTDVTPAGLYDPVAVADNNGRIVVVTGVNGSGTYASDTGTSFAKVNASYNFGAVRAFGGVFYGIAGVTSTFTMVSSPTGTVWTTIAPMPLAYNVVVGSSGIGVGYAGGVGAINGIYKSVDGALTWTHTFVGNVCEAPGSGTYFAGKYLWGTGTSGNYDIFISSDLTSFSAPVISTGPHGSTTCVWAGETL